jgi:hypothetical protein
VSLKETTGHVLRAVDALERTGMSRPQVMDVRTVVASNGTVGVLQ